MARMTNKTVLSSAAFPAFFSALNFRNSFFASLILTRLSFRESDLNSLTADFTSAELGSCEGPDITGSDALTVIAGEIITNRARMASRVKIRFIICKMK